MSDATSSFKKRVKVLHAGRKRKESSSDASSDSGDAPCTTTVKRTKKTVTNPMVQSTKKVAANSEHITYSSSDDESKVTTSYKSSGKKEGPTDMGATATFELDTEIGRDARAIFERSQALSKELKDKEDDKVYRGMNNYAQYYERRDTAAGSAFSGLVPKGPLRAPANIRTTVRWDYAPDICKDYKETGFCGFGDSCKFLHDRGDYKHGWQLERETEHPHPSHDEDMSKYEISDDDDDLPFRCFICRDSFKNPIVTKCKHYFCESCALKNYKKTTRCFVCNQQTNGVFNPAKDLIAKIKKADDKKSEEPSNTQHSDSD